MNRKTTIRDVAKATGVSITTISQILNGVGRFSDATIERVWKAVNEMNYTPNEHAKKIFAKDTSERVKTGLLMRVTYVPFDHEQLFPIQTNHVEAYCSLCFGQACQRNDYSGTNYYYRHPYGFRSRLLLNGLIDGAVLGTPDSDIIENVKKRVPAVLTDVNVDPEDVGLSVINADFISAYADAITIIRKAGIDGNIAFFCGLPKKANNLHNVIKPGSPAKLLKEAMIRCGLEANTKYFYEGHVSPETNDRMLEEIADHVCHLVREENVHTVVLRHYDSKNFVNMLRNRGLKVPEDVVVMGVRYVPQKQERGFLQIIRDWRMMMETAVDVLIKTIETPEIDCKKYAVPCQKITDSFLFEPDRQENSL